MVMGDLSDVDRLDRHPDPTVVDGDAGHDGLTTLVFAVREEADRVIAERYGPLERRVRLYERTMGLAVLPVLLRRSFIVLGRRLRERTAR